MPQLPAQQRVGMLSALCRVAVPRSHGACKLNLIFQYAREILLKRPGLGAWRAGHVAVCDRIC